MFKPIASIISHRYFKAGLSTAKVFTALKAQGVPIQAEKVVDKVRQIKARYDKAVNLNDTGMSEYFSHGNFVQHKLSRPYRFYTTFQYEQTNILTGVTQEKYFSYYYDDEMTKEELIQDFEERYEGFKYNKDLNITFKQIEFIEHNLGFGYEPF